MCPLINPQHVYFCVAVALITSTRRHILFRDSNIDFVGQGSEVLPNIPVRVPKELRGLR